ncbi:Endonuclease/exonuclease/phosphatase [Hyaloraphidium curvatum]|nr:Endonuclease/exonuclease/phosphatase [Hyaloraphidium curvatum]
MLATMRPARPFLALLPALTAAPDARRSSTSAPPRPLTLATLNTYLIPPFLSKRHAALPPALRAVPRAGRLAAWLPASGADLAFLQEVWGPGTDLLNRVPGYSSGPPDVRSVVTEGGWVPAGAARTAWDWWRMWNAATGGLWFASKDGSVPPARWTGRHTYTVSATPSRKGVLGSLWDVSGHWGKGARWLCVFSTHLDAWNDGNKRVQLKEMADFVGRSLAGPVRSAVEAAEREGWGGRPESWTKGPIGAHHADPMARVAVVLVGDFNIAAPASADAAVDGSASGHSALYASELLGMIPPRKLVDLFAAFRGQDDRTATYDKVNNALVEPGPGNHGRIDHVLGLGAFEDPVSGRTVELMPLRCVGAEVVRQQPGLELSDHYPVVVRLVPEPRAED